MKRILSIAIAFVIIFIAVVLAMVAFPGDASAGTEEELSIAMLGLMISKSRESEASKLLFDIDNCYAYENSDGDIVAMMVSNFPYTIYKASGEDIKPQLCGLWASFNEVHILFSKRDFYLSIMHEENLIYFVGADMIVDWDFNIYPNTRQM